MINNKLNLKLKRKVLQINNSKITNSKIIKKLTNITVQMTKLYIKFIIVYNFIRHFLILKMLSSKFTTVANIDQFYYFEYFYQLMS